jgi:hypothetical protein
MVFVGRALSMAVLIAVMIGFALAGIDSGRLLQDGRVLLLYNVLGALTPLSLLIAGALSLYQWGTRVPNPSRRWRISGSWRSDSDSFSELPVTGGSVRVTRISNDPTVEREALPGLRTGRAAPMAGLCARRLRGDDGRGTGVLLVSGQAEQRRSPVAVSPACELERMIVLGRFLSLWGMLALAVAGGERSWRRPAGPASGDLSGGEVGRVLGSPVPLRGLEPGAVPLGNRVRRVRQNEALLGMGDHPRRVSGAAAYWWAGARRNSRGDAEEERG